MTAKNFESHINFKKLLLKQKCAIFQICKGKRKFVNDYATKKCQQFSQLLPQLDNKASGLQATYESGKFKKFIFIIFITRRARKGNLNYSSLKKAGYGCRVLYFAKEKIQTPTIRLELISTI